MRASSAEKNSTIASSSTLASMPISVEGFMRLIMGMGAQA
jgi:hypothetical protein